ncbi:MAG: NADH-quinone oxidoreductase subunit NuoH [Elusimicrobia bacterium]|nr:NADH-quinone oxidoreductase subunit NuoH [Elusimicrobiota bacterium]
MLGQCAAILAVINLTVMFLIWLERKVSAHMQSRLGPMYAGGWHGWAKSIADGIKLLVKQDIVPTGADPWVHRLAPVIAFVPAFACYAPLPFGRQLAAVNLDIGILYVFAISGLSVLGILMAGWGSGNKYSMLGGLRAAAQLVSYEVPRVLSVVPVLLWVGSQNLSLIVDTQRHFKWFLFYPNPLVGVIAFLVFFTASVAECNRTPFDIPEAESEIVAGFHTEYSGIKFAFFFLAEYAFVFLSAGLGAVLFLGGGDGVLLPSWVWFLFKTFLLVFVFMWVRWTFPRFRVDRLLAFSWKFLTPVSFANIVLAGLTLHWLS